MPKLIKRLWKNKVLLFCCPFCAKDGEDEKAMTLHMETHRDHFPRWPKVSAVMLTMPSRMEQARMAIRQFLEQDYPGPKELIVLAYREGQELFRFLDDHPELIFLIGPPEVGSVGERRNLANIKATGRYIIHWDDDDHHSPCRLRKSMEAVHKPGIQLAGIVEPQFITLDGDLYVYQTPSPFLHGASLIYSVDLWKSTPFRPVNLGEDRLFVQAYLGNRKASEHPGVVILDPDLLLCQVGNNTAPKKLLSSEYKRQGIVLNHPLMAKKEVVALSYLTWNHELIAADSFRSLVRESHRLLSLGYNPLILALDNGSRDRTFQVLQEAKANCDVPSLLISNRENEGNSRSRNKLISLAEEHGAEWLFFNDGDIELIPWTVPHFIGFLRTEKRAGCVGLHSAGDTKQREEASPFVPSLFTLRKEWGQPVAWTQYGLFRMEMFRQGIRFETRPPYDGPGWGFEDNDLYLQMKMQGWQNPCIHGLTYLHRDRHSSIGFLRNEGIDPVSIYRARQSFLTNKWGAEPIMKEDVAKLAATVLRE